VPASIFDCTLKEGDRKVFQGRVHSQDALKQILMIAEQVASIRGHPCSEPSGCASTHVVGISACPSGLPEL
jgi:hypothetical protein